jgi:hypothetical protein
MHIIQRLIFFLFVVLALMKTGCSSDDSTEKQVIEIQEREAGEYRDLKKITDKDQVQQVREIVGDAEWEEKIVNIGRPADYWFTFQYEEPDAEAKPVLHELWTSADAEKAEMVRGETEYSQLKENDAAALIEVLTGK